MACLARIAGPYAHRGSSNVSASAAVPAWSTSSLNDCFVRHGNLSFRAQVLVRRSGSDNSDRIVGDLVVIHFDEMSPMTGGKRRSRHSPVSAEALIANPRVSPRNGADPSQRRVPGRGAHEFWDGMSDEQREPFYDSVGESCLSDASERSRRSLQAYVYPMSNGFATGQMLVVDGGTVLSEASCAHYRDGASLVARREIRGGVTRVCSQRSGTS